MPFFQFPNFLHSQAWARDLASLNCWKWILKVGLSPQLQLWAENCRDQVQTRGTEVFLDPFAFEFPRPFLGHEWWDWNGIPLGLVLRTRGEFKAGTCEHMVHPRAVVIHPYFISWKSTYLFLPESNLWACLPSSWSSTIFSSGDILEESLVQMKVIRKILAAGSSAGTQGEESLLNSTDGFTSILLNSVKVTGEGNGHLGPTTSNGRAVHIPGAKCFFSWLYSFIQQIFDCALFLY